MKGRDVLAGATRAASYNIVLQFSVRMLTFVLNAFIVRYIAKEVLGVANVRLMLFLTTTQFLSRECMRKACLSSNVAKDWRQVINLLWIGIPLTAFWSCVLGLLWIYALQAPDVSSVPHYAPSVLCFMLAAVLESMVEPLWVTAQTFLFVKLRVVLESVFNLVKCLTIVALVLICPGWGLYIFSIAQITAALLYAVAYFGYFNQYIKKQKKSEDKSFPLRSTRDMFPQKIQNKPYFDWQLAVLSWSFLKQSFLKQILTEGERYVMTISNILNFADQGVFDVVNNLGALAARFLFAPIEESGYLFFSQSLQRGLSAQEQQKDSLDLASRVLQHLLKLVTLIGSIALAFGWSYSYLLLDLYGGQSLSTGVGPVLLRWYCLYMYVIAMNGITECFVFAAMSKEQVDRYSQKMLLFSILFLVSSWFLTDIFGVIGFVHAGYLNMTARIIHSVYYIKRYYKNTSYSPLQGLLPTPPYLLMLSLLAIIMGISEVYFCHHDSSVQDKLLHVAIGAVSGLMVLAAIYFTEKDLITFVKDEYTQRKKDKKS